MNIDLVLPNRQIVDYQSQIINNCFFLSSMRKRNKPKAIYTPHEREIIVAIKQAVCKVYEITEKDLLTNVSFSIECLRFYCFCLLMRNTCIKDYAIAEAFGKSRNAVKYGVEQIDSQKDVYKETLNN